MKNTMLIMAALLAAAAMACGTDNGTVRLLLTDKPVDGVEQLNVTISSVEIHLVASDDAKDSEAKDDGAADGDKGKNDEAEETGAEEDDNAWRVVTDEVQTFDLLTLRNGVTTLLGESEFPEGKITQIRLILEKAEAVVNGQTVPVECPSSCGKTGIKIVTRGALEVVAGKAAELTLDFDASESLKDNGKGGYKMDHVIKVVKQEQK